MNLREMPEFDALSCLIAWGTYKLDRGDWRTQGDSGWVWAWYFTRWWLTLSLIHAREPLELTLLLSTIWTDPGGAELGREAADCLIELGLARQVGTAWEPVLIPGPADVRQPIATWWQWLVQKTFVPSNWQQLCRERFGGDWRP